MHYLYRIYNNFKLYGILLTINRIIFFIYIYSSSFIRKKINLDKIILKKKQSLNYYFNFFDCDKGYEVYPPYHFSWTKKKFSNLGPVYEKYLKKFRNKKISILEIGVYRGKSMASFLSYFQKALYFGIDIMPNLNEFKSQRARIFKSNSTIFNLKNLNNVKFNFIIDDGSHIKKEVIQNFNKFSSLIKKGGYYIVEDVNENIFEYFKKFYKANCNVNKFSFKLYKNRRQSNSVLIIQKNVKIFK